jgi:3-hydroxyacyl-[acyl-carrier-protein] dehydratase
VNPVREQIRSLLRVESRQGGFVARLRVDPNLVVLPDHFPNYPILPGICMIQAVLLAGAARENCSDMRLRKLKNAKMMQPVLPGMELVIDAVMTAGSDGDFLIRAKLSDGEKRCAEFVLTAAVEKGVRA